MTTTITIYRHRVCVRFILCALLLILLPACGGENGPDNPDDSGFEEGIPTEVRITLSARSSNAQTRAKRDGEDKDPTSSIELMHDDWWIVFIDKNGAVKIIGQKDPSVTDRIKSIPSSVENPDGGFEAETFKIILPSGTYRIYAFANVPRKSDAEFKTFLKDSGGHKAANIGDFIGTDRFVNDSMQWPVKRMVDGKEIDNNIPMTAVIPEQRINNTIEEALNIEVIRAVAKVEFAFSNPSDDDYVVEKLKFGPLTCNYKVSFVPNNDSIGFGPNDKLNRDDIRTDTIKFSDISLTADPLKKYNMGLFSFYCKESLPKSNEAESETKKLGGPFTIKLTVKKNGVTQPERTFLTKKITYINRNDWIRIPIEFSDWKIYWKLRTYPPIGGYPPLFDQNEDGSSLKATVTTGGEFELYPSKIMKGTQDFTSNVDWTKDVTLTVLEGSDDIFITEPHLEADPNKANAKIIVGELDPKKTGTAKVQIDFFLDSTTTGITDVRTCTFTIIRQN